MPIQKTGKLVLFSYFFCCFIMRIKKTNNFHS